MCGSESAIRVQQLTIDLHVLTYDQYMSSYLHVLTSDQDMSIYLHVLTYDQDMSIDTEHEPTSTTTATCKPPFSDSMGDPHVSGRARECV